jgi:hypothetical protein
LQKIALLLFVRMRRSFSRQDSLPRYPDQLVLHHQDPAPLVPPLDLGGGSNQRALNTRAFSKDPQFEERTAAAAAGHRNPAFAAADVRLNGGSPAAYYPRIKDSLSLARARLDAALAYDDDERMFDDIDSVGDIERRLDAGGGGGVAGLQQVLRGGGGGGGDGGPKPRDSIEIYRHQQEHYLQVKRRSMKRRHLYAGLLIVNLFLL